MRCSITNPRKIRRLERITGIAVLEATTRGNTHHRIDIKGKDGFSYSLYNDGDLTKSKTWLGDEKIIKNCQINDKGKQNDT